MADTDTQEQAPWTKYQAPPPSTDEEGPWSKYAAAPAAPKNVPVRKPGEAKPLTTEEVNKFQPPTKFEQAHEQPAPLYAPVPGAGVVDVGTIGHAAKEYGKDILGMGKSMVEQLPGMGTIGHVASGEWGEAAKDVLPGARLVEGGIEHLRGLQESDIQRKEAGRSLAYRALAGGAQATGVVDPTGMEAAAERGDTSGVLAHAAAQATPVLAAEAIRSPAGRAARGAIEDVGTRAGGKVAEMRQPARIANFRQTVLDLTGKTPADLDFVKKVDLVTPDAAKIARETSFDEKGNARVGEFREQFVHRGRQIWSEEHAPQINRQSHVSFDHETPYQAAVGSLDQQMRNNNPAAARAVDRWAAQNLSADNIGTVGKADNAMRSYNAANPDVPEPYKNLMRIAQGKAMEAIRAGLEAKLQDAGEEGVSNPNSRYGAIKEITDALDAHTNNVANRPLDTWRMFQNAGRTGSHLAWGGAALGSLTGAVFGAPAEGAEIGGGIGAAAGIGTSLAHDVLSQPGGRIARAMRGLAKTNLEPNEVQPGIPRLPYRAGPDTSGPTSGGIGPYTNWNPPGPAPPNAPGEVGGTAFNENRIGAAGREGTRFAPKGLLPAPPPEAPVGVLPTAGGPVTAPMWGRPVVQPQPGFELPNQELMGPWGSGAAPETPPQTVAPMKPPTNFPPKEAQQEPLNFTKPAPKAEQNVPRDEIKSEAVEKKPVAEEKPVPIKGTAEAVEKPTGKPPEGVAERRQTQREKEAGDFHRNAVMDDLRKTAMDKTGTIPVDERARALRTLNDMIAHPEERHEGADINQVKAMTKPTMTREEAEAASAARKVNRAEGVLLGMEEHVAKQAEGAAKVKGEELTAEMNRPRSVEEAAGHIESRGELFRAAGAGPQNEMFRPGGEPVKPMTPPVEAPKEEEPVETQIKGITAKEPKTAKAKAVKAKPIDQRFTQEEILEAEGLLNTETGMMAAGEKPGVYYDEYTQDVQAPLTQNQDFRHGERAGGKWRGVRSGRDMYPFMRDHPEFNPQAVQKALRNKDSAAYTKMMEAALEYIRESKLSPEEREAKTKERFGDFAKFRPPKEKFVNLKKPVMREPGED